MIWSFAILVDACVSTCADGVIQEKGWVSVLAIHQTGNSMFIHCFLVFFCRNRSLDSTTPFNSDLNQTKSKVLLSLCVTLFSVLTCCTSGLPRLPSH